MKYCGKCKRLFSGANTEHCPGCGRRAIDSPSPSSPVFLLTANGFELERITAALHGAGIPSTYQETRRDAGLQILNAAPPENCDLYVPLAAYEEASDLLIGIGALREEDAFAQDDPALPETAPPAEEEDLPDKKAKAIRIASAILFLGLIAAAVFLADLLCEWIPRLLLH